MSIPKEKLSAENITFFAAARENTGAALCDSGGVYGRHHEAPEIDPESPAIRMDVFEHDGKISLTFSLSTPHYLDAHYDIDRKLQKAFERFAAKNPDFSWFECGAAFMEKRGYTQAHRGNPYNGDCDLTQVFVVEVWEPDEKAASREGIYAHDDTVVVFYLHTGCDVRGGYGRPIFCHGTADYALPMDYMVEFSIVDSKDCLRTEDGEFDREAAYKIDERWQNGYSSCPQYRMSEDVEKILSVDEKAQTFWAKLKTGEEVQIAAGWRDSY